jgi:hypothetical protein
MLITYSESKSFFEDSEAVGASPVFRRIEKVIDAGFNWLFRIDRVLVF